jgi:hypothetical protein
MHIPPCVFVVAADKQAIEQALGEQARQATPEDVVNPYYSAGSASTRFCSPTGSRSAEPRTGRWTRTSQRERQR